MSGFSFKKAVQAMNYFAKHEGGRTKRMKALKLIWLSDRLHVRQYGRLITGDDYFAMRHGPVASSTMDLSKYYASGNALEYSQKFIQPDGEHHIVSISDPDLNVFSDSDVESMEIVWNEFGGLEEFELSDLSHFFPEWKRHKATLDSGRKRVSILLSDFFSESSEGKNIFENSDEAIALSKMIFEEHQKIQNAL